jgi:hypothetical protein
VKANPSIPLSRVALLLAIASLLLVLFSYATVILLALACVYLPYLGITNSEHFHAELLVLFLGGAVIAAAMLWSLVPKRQQFVAPGLRLDIGSEPKLFSEINAIAAALNEPMPAEVYLTSEVNAFVMEEGGFMGMD